MPATSRLVAAIEVFKKLGWADAEIAAAATLPLGTPEQRRIARDGLKSGEWGEFGQIRENTYGWISWIDVDPSMLALFAVRAGVDARRAATIMTPASAGDDLATRILAPRGPAFAARFIDAACRSSRRPFEHSASVHAGPAVRLVAQHALAIPANVEYLKDWAVYALEALTGEDADLAVSQRGNLDPRVIADRFAEHARIAVTRGVPATGPFGKVFVPAVERGWIERAEAVELAFTALDGAQRPGDRKVWARTLMEDLRATDAEVLAHADALIPVLGFGDAPVTELLAPTLIAGVDDDTLVDLLTAALPVKTRKTKRTLLQAAIRRSRPRDDVADVIGGLVAPLTTDRDRALARAASTLAEAWHLDAEPPVGEAVATQGWWQPTPPVWQVPRFEVGEVSSQALTAAAAELTSRAEDVVDVATERFLALANAVARKDEAAARDALRGVRRPGWVAGLRSVPTWLAGKPGPVLDRVAGPGRSVPYPTIHGPETAREGAVFQRLGTVPCLLSTPTWVDLRIDPADLVTRLGEYAATGVAAAEGDLLLAMTRTDLSLVTDETLAALGSLDVPVVLQSGETMAITAGPAVCRYVADPVVEPNLTIQTRWRHWAPEPLTVPASLAQFPDRLSPGSGRSSRFGPAEFPTWADAAGKDVAHDEYGAGLGLALRQFARRAAPLPPGVAVNMLAAQRGFHPRAAADGAAAVVEAWERGLLRPGVADARYLDWTETPSGLASFARACREVAEDGLASVVWPVLDDLVGVSAARPRSLAGTVELVETLATLLPETRAAMAAGVAEATVLDLPGVRALAARPGSGRGVILARSLVAGLPEPVTAPPTAPAPTPDPGPTFDDVWPPTAGTAPAIDDGAQIAVSILDPSAPTKMLAVDITIPGPDGGQFRVVKGWMFDLEVEGQCAAHTFHGGLPPLRSRHRWPPPDSWLRWDEGAGRLVASEHRNWRDGTDGPLGRDSPTPPLTTSMVAAVLAVACQDDPPLYAVSNIAGRGLFGWRATIIAVRALLTQADVSPARMVRIVEKRPDTLPVLWPVLTESVRHASGLAGTLPRWLPRVLDAALLRAPLLREAARRGLIPADAAAWPGLAEIAGRGGKSATVRKAGELRDALGIDR